MAFRVYTKTGDKGTTALIGGTRVEKSNIRIDAYGTVDELNSYIGLILASFNTEHHQYPVLREIQDRLFTVGASLATDPNKDIKMALPDLLDEDIIYIENNIDLMDDQLPALKNFVLPGSDIHSSHCHVARCICRRAERICVNMVQIDEFVADIVLRYLNRLSDYLFVLSRYIAFENKSPEIEWSPRIKKG